MLALSVSARRRPAAVGIATATSGGAAVVAGVAGLAGQTFAVSLPDLLPLFGVHLALDPLGGLFIAVTGGVAVAASAYGIGYAADDDALRSRAAQLALPVFVVAMVLVPVAASVGTFLVSWELMALSSLVLVVVEHRRRPQVAAAGRWYAVMTHLGVLAILLGLAVLAAGAGGETFAALRAAEFSPVVRDVAFVTTLLGFASKAGVVPLHAWLPRAHPEAPAHVSALMSAAMVALGVYGIVRLGLDLLGGGPQWWWLVVLGAGAFSAVYGILQAAMSTDLKRLLGYSTIENMGLILVGVGAAGVMAAAGHQALAGLAMAAALLHVINHAAFKTLLFQAAGSVLHGTGTGDLDRLGGLRRGMPATTAMFGIGALAASALPLGAAFGSEWLLLQSLIHGVATAGMATAVAMPVAVAAVALTAGLATATFVKTFGIGFLAKPRGAAAAGARESGTVVVSAMGLVAGACVVLALAPAAIVPALAPAVGAAGPLLAEPVTDGLLTMRLTVATGSLSPVILTVAVLAAAFVLVVVLRLVAARSARRQGRPPGREARLWDCGAGPMSARMEYTATSFAEPLQRVFDDIVDPELDVDVTHVAESRYLVDTVVYRQRVIDRIESRFYQPVLRLVGHWGRAGRWLANGSIHRYLAYGFVALLVLLVVIR